MTFYGNSEEMLFLQKVANGTVFMLNWTKFSDLLCLFVFESLSGLFLHRCDENTIRHQIRIFFLRESKNTFHFSTDSAGKSIDTGNLE